MRVNRRIKSLGHTSDGSDPTRCTKTSGAPCDASTVAVAVYMSRLVSADNSVRTSSPDIIEPDIIEPIGALRCQQHCLGPQPFNVDPM